MQASGEPPNLNTSSKPHTYERGAPALPFNFTESQCAAQARRPPMAKSPTKPSKKLSAAQAQRIARVTHEAVRAWQVANGQDPAPPWSRAPAWMKTATLEAVHWNTSGTPSTPASRHRQWVEEKKQAGWKFGRRKDARRKTHPLMVAYNQLPEVERRKDALVSAVIESLTTRMR